MKAYNRSALAILSLVSAASCKEELADPSLLDAGARPAASVDAGTGTSSGDGGLAACNSASMPSGGKCGGLQCNQTLQELRAGTQASAACGNDEEVAAFCSNDSVDAVSDCARTAVGVEAATRACAKAALPNFTDDCIDCYVKSAACAAQKCLSDCSAGDSPACDACRVAMGCMPDFHACSGHKAPPR